MKILLAVLLCIIMAMSFAACGSSTDKGSSAGSESKAASEYKVDPEATTLTISDGSTQKEYTADDLKKLGMEKNTYSGRNKKVQNARFFEEYEGVDLKTLFEDAGFKTDGASMKVVCSDGLPESIMWMSFMANTLSRIMIPTKRKKSILS